MRCHVVFLLLLSLSFALQTNANPIMYNLSDGQRIEAKDVMFLNDHSADIHLYLSAEGEASKFLKIKNTEIDLLKGESEWVEYEIFVPEGTKSGEYVGYIVATLNGGNGGARINLALKKKLTILVSGKEEIIDFIETLFSFLIILFAAYILLTAMTKKQSRKKKFLILLLLLFTLSYAPSQDIQAGVEILYTCGIVNEPTSLDFGSFVSGQYSGVKNTTVTNTGNVDVDIAIYGTDWVKGGDSFTVDNTKYSLDESNYYNLSYAPTIIYNNLSPASSLDIFFKVYVPVGKSGRYQQNITIGGICP